MNSQDPKVPSAAPKWGESSLVPLLSLKLLLLAFFILLNARSNLEVLKVDAVLSSVNRAFNGQVVVARNVSTQSAASGPMETTAFALTAVGQLFEAMLPAVQRRETPRGPVMSLELAAGSFFPTGDARLHAGRNKILDRLVETLQVQGQAYDYEIRFLHARDPKARGLPGLAGERLQTLAESLVARGLPVERLQVGFFGEARERVRFEIRMTPRPVAASGADTAAASAHPSRP